jgi:hypothetical protein
MSICQFYNLGVQHRISKEINSNHQASLNTTKTPWCSHNDSPVTLEQTNVIGGAFLLRCGGDLDKCQLPEL